MGIDTFVAVQLSKSRILVIYLVIFTFRGVCALEFSTQKHNGLCYEDILLAVCMRRHRGQWVATTDDFTTENDDESSISSLSDLVPESEVKPANVTQLEAKKTVP